MLFCSPFQYLDALVLVTSGLGPGWVLYIHLPMSLWAFILYFVYVHIYAIYDPILYLINDLAQLCSNFVFAYYFLFWLDY